MPALDGSPAAEASCEMPSLVQVRGRILCRWVLLVAATVGWRSALSAQQAPRDSATILRDVMAAETKFLARWRAAWLASDWDAWSAFNRTNSTRNTPVFQGPQLQHLRCVYAWAPPIGIADPARMANRIGSSSALPSLFCPSWTVENPHYADASIVLDSALSPARRDSMARARDSLLTTLADAARELPGSTFIAGQRVRFLLNQAYRATHYSNEALTAARDCRGDDWFCASLVGLVFSHQRRLDSAQAAFARARSRASDTLRCQMAEITALLDRSAVPREFVAPATCGDKHALAERYWWLADGLWSDHVNERRIEHDARTVALLLAASLPRDERFDWAASVGGDAAAQLITRYGWPGRMVWSAVVQSRIVGTPPNQQVIGRGYRNGIDPFESAPSPPFTTQEYPWGRTHLGPSWTALIDPFTARASDWQFTAPPGVERRRWWPSEHMRRERPLIAIEEWQAQTWRRADSLFIALAARAPEPLRGDGFVTPSIHASLIRSTGPSASSVVDDRRGRGDEVLILSGRVPTDSAVLSFELTGLGALRRDARTRFAIAVLPPLKTLNARELALSTPVLLRAGEPRAVQADTAVAHMLPSTTIGTDRRIGVFWESYGFADDDTVDIEVRVERLDRPGRFERITASVGLGEREVSGTTIRWREPQPGVRQAGPINVPAIHSRSMTLNLTGLRPGAFALVVTLRTRDGRTASSLRHLSIAPPTD